MSYFKYINWICFMYWICRYTCLNRFKPKVGKNLLIAHWHHLKTWGLVWPLVRDVRQVDIKMPKVRLHARIFGCKSWWHQCQPTTNQLFNGWKSWFQTIFYVINDLVRHPIEATVKQLVFQVPWFVSLRMIQNLTTRSLEIPEPCYTESNPIKKRFPADS